MVFCKRIGGGMNKKEDNAERKTGKKFIRIFFMRVMVIIGNARLV